MSIRKKLSLIMLVVGLLPMLAVSVVAYFIISRGLTSRTVDQLVSTATKQEQKISGLLQGRQEEAIKLSNRFDLQSAMGSYLDKGDVGSRQAIDEILASKKVQTPNIQAIYVARPDGSIVATTNSSDQSKQLAPEDYALQSGEETATFVREDQRDGIVKLYVTTKINVNKQTAGYLSVVFRIDDIIAAVQDYTGLGATGETLVAAKQPNGDVITLFPLRFDSDAALKVPLNNLHLYDHLGASYDGVADYRGQQVLVASRSVGFADWVIATKIDQQEALAPINQLRDSLLLIALLLSGVTGFIALYFTKFFTGPIRRIAQTAQQIGRGAFDARVVMPDQDEIGMLARSVNIMAHNLEVMVTNIESQRNQLEIILNSTTESIVAIDGQGKIVIANESAAGLAQLDMAQLIGQNINDVFAWTHDMQPFAIAYDTPGARTYFDLQYKNKAGVTRYVRLIVSQASGGYLDGRVQTIVTIHDETKSRELENMKIDFVSMAAHELRTPLAAIRGYLELITYKAREIITPEMQQYVKQALRSTAELGALINNLLNVTRIERGTLTFHLEKVDLAAEIRQVMQEMSFSAEDKKIKLDYIGPDTGAFVAADQIALREVIGNLLSNAIKYTDTGGSVRAMLRNDGSVYTVHIKDTGIGIPEQAIPNLFTKFFRAHSGLNSGNPGTGLGLFITKSILERHHGTISVQSREGVGSVFAFTLPQWSEELLHELRDGEQIAETNVRRHRGWVTKDTPKSPDR